METMGLPCGKGLGPGVHALQGRVDMMNQFGVVKNAPILGSVEARLCTTPGGRFDDTSGANGNGDIVT